MKALTVKQPWASLIVNGVKDIENRTWKTNFRGRVLIHAGMAKAEFNFSWLQTLELNRLNLRRWYNREQIKGKIIGSVEIMDCVINHPSIWAEKTDLYDTSMLGLKPTYNWVLANPILFDKPIPAKGKLSFWEFDETLIK